MFLPLVDVVDYGVISMCGWNGKRRFPTSTIRNFIRKLIPSRRIKVRERGDIGRWMPDDPHISLIFFPQLA